MAHVTSIETKEAGRHTKQGEVQAAYCTFEIDGDKYFQIDTYGSPDRETPWQPSQSIQFDSAFAKKLVALLIEEFWE